MSKRQFTIAVSLLVAVFLMPAGAQQRRAVGSPHRIIIEGATLIDGTGAAPLPNAVVVIEGNKIQSITSGSFPVAQDGMTVIKAQGKFILPGLFDAHTHWRGWTGELFLAHGVETVIDWGDGTDWMLAVRSADEAGRIRGPRLFTSGNMIAHPGGPSSFSFTDTVVVPSPVANVRTPEEARTAVRLLLEKGVDAIDIGQGLTTDELSIVTSEAHKAGLAVIGQSDNLYESVNHGSDGITGLLGVAETLMSPESLAAFREHRIACPFAFMQMEKMDRLISFLVQHGTYLTPSMIGEHLAVLPRARDFEMENYQLLMSPDLRYVPQAAVLSSLSFFHQLSSFSRSLGPFPYIESADSSVIDEFRRGYMNSQEFVRRFVWAGGKVTAGTDVVRSAMVPGASLLQELQLLVDAGLTPMQAIQSATQIPAKMIHVDYKLGTLERNKLADLVIVAADPLADIGNITKIETVIKDGRVIDTTYHRDYAPAFSELEGGAESISAAGIPVISELFNLTLNQNSEVIHGGSSFEMVVKGEKFRPSSLILINGRPLATQFASSRELHAQVPTDRIPVAGTVPVTVMTPWPGGGTSNVATLTVK